MWPLVSMVMPQVAPSSLMVGKTWQEFLLSKPWSRLQNSDIFINTWNLSGSPSYHLSSETTWLHKASSIRLLGFLQQHMQAHVCSSCSILHFSHTESGPRSGTHMSMCLCNITYFLQSPVFEDGTFQMAPKSLSPVIWFDHRFLSQSFLDAGKDHPATRLSDSE